jgi:hypothetical protein
MKYGVLENQWLGSSVAAALNGPIIACAHRYVYAKFDTKWWFPVGRCTVLNSTFSVNYRLHPAADFTDRYPGAMENLRGVLFSQDGISAQVSESGDVIAFGGPGAFRWEGLLHVVTTDPKRPISTKHKDAGEHRPYVGKDECDFRVESPKLAYLGNKCVEVSRKLSPGGLIVYTWLCWFQDMPLIL